MCLCVLGMCVSVTERVLEREGRLCVGSVCLSNGLTSGRKAIDDLIKISRLFFAPLGKGLLYVSAALCSLFFLPAPLSLPPPSTLSPPFSPSQPPFPLNILLFSTSRLLSCFQRPETDHCLHKNGCRPLLIFFAFHIALRLPSGACHDLTVMERTDGG